MSVIQDNSITSNNIQPASGQALTIKDEGGDASITVATNGEATFAENIIVGTAGKGINFSNATDVGTGETVGTNGSIFDDYEEGDCSITFGFSSTSADIGITSLTAKYVKAGRLVNVQFNCQRSDSGAYTGSEALYIRNLPFVTEQVACFAGAFWLDPGSGNGYKCFLYLLGDSSYGILSHGSTPSTASRYVTPINTYWPNTNYMFGSITYNSKY